MNKTKTDVWRTCDKAGIKTTEKDARIYRILFSYRISFIE